MATSPDGILEAAFDPAQNLTRLVVDGGMWPVPGVLRRNLIPNPSFEGVSSGALWGVTGGTGVAVATFGQMWSGLGGRVGVNIMQAASDGASNYLTLAQSTSTAFPVTAGKWVGITALIANDS